MKKILITGYDGFIGQYLWNKFTANNNNILYGISNNIIQKNTAYQVDITNQNQVCNIINKIQPDVIIHLAAISTPNIDTNLFPTTIKINTLGTTNIAHYTPLNCRLINISTITVYGNYNNKPFEEKDDKFPTSIYSVSKLAGEEIVNTYRHLNNLNAITLRPCAVVGPNLSHGVIKDFIYKIKNDKTLKILGEYPGSKKPYLYIEDLYNIINICIDTYSNLQNTINIAPNDNVSVDQIADIIMDIYKIKKKKVWTHKNFGGDNNYILVNNNKMQSTFKYNVKSSIDAITLAVQEIKKNEN